MEQDADNPRVLTAADFNRLLGRVAQLSPGASLLGVLKGANFNTTADQAIAVVATRYVIRRIVAANPSVSLTAAAGGIYLGAGKTGTIIVPAAQAYAALTAPLKFLDLTLAAVVGTDYFTAPQVLLSLTVPQGVAATGDIYIFGDVLD